MNDTKSTSDTLAQGKDAVRQAAGQARGFVSQQMDERSTAIGEQISSHVDQLKQVGEQLRGVGGEPAAKLADTIAGQADRVAQYLKDADGDTLLHDFETLGRRQPLAVIAAGFVLGVAASRLLKAGSVRRYQQYGDESFYGSNRSLGETTATTSGSGKGSSSPANRSSTVAGGLRGA